AAFAEALQEDILAELQIGTAAEEQLVHLVGGQPAAANQLARQPDRVGEARLQSIEHLALLCFLQKLHAGETLDQIPHVGDRHYLIPHPESERPVALMQTIARNRRLWRRQNGHGPGRRHARLPGPRDFYDAARGYVSPWQPRAAEVGSGRG